MEPILELRNGEEFTSLSLTESAFPWSPGISWALLEQRLGKTTTIKLIMNLSVWIWEKLKSLALIPGGMNRKSQHRLCVRRQPFYEELTAAQMTKVVAPFYKQWDWDAYNRYIHPCPPD